MHFTYIAARSYALLGDVAAVREVVDDANRDYDDSTSDRDLLAGEVGGEFAFETPRAAACVAAAWTRGCLRHASVEVAPTARTAEG